MEIATILCLYNGGAQIGTAGGRYIEERFLDCVSRAHTPREGQNARNSARNDDADLGECEERTTPFGRLADETFAPRPAYPHAERCSMAQTGPQMRYPRHRSFVGPILLIVLGVLFLLLNLYPGF